MQPIAKSSVRIMNTSQLTQPNSGLKVRARVLGCSTETGVGDFSWILLSIFQQGSQPPGLGCMYPANVLGYKNLYILSEGLIGD